MQIILEDHFSHDFQFWSCWNQFFYVSKSDFNILSLQWKLSWSGCPDTPAQEGGFQLPHWIFDGTKSFELAATDVAVLCQGSQS